jgi:hypothetical protein
MGPTGHVDRDAPARSCGARAIALGSVPSSRANPSRGGDAKPGISLEETARLPIAERIRQDSKESSVKANLARFTGALALLASLALTIGAGVRWA